MKSCWSNRDETLIKYLIHRNDVTVSFEFAVSGVCAAPEEPLRLGLHPHLAERRAPGVLGETEGSRGEE